MDCSAPERAGSDGANQDLKPGLLPSPPFAEARRHAARHGCDLAVAGNIGLGSLICFAPVAEALARRLGRPIRLLTAPYRHYRNTDLAPADRYPVWQNNPYVGAIVDADAIDPQIDYELCQEAHNYCQSGHNVENMLAAYGLRPRRLRGSLHLDAAEQRAALETLAHLPRPVICLSPHAESAPPPDSPWHLERWRQLVERLDGRAGFFQVGFDDFGRRPLPVFAPSATIRQMMALIWAADAYVGVDGGPSHIATALETPAVVLWDAVRKVGLEEAKHPGFATAMLNRWAYPQNLNLMLLGERNAEILDRVAEHLLEILGRHGHPAFAARGALKAHPAGRLGDRSD